MFYLRLSGLCTLLLIFPSCALTKAAYLVCGGDNRPELREELATKQHRLTFLKEEQNSLNRQLSSNQSRLEQAQQRSSRAQASGNPSEYQAAQQEISQLNREVEQQRLRMNTLRTEISELSSLAR